MRSSTSSPPCWKNRNAGLSLQQSATAAPGTPCSYVSAMRFCGNTALVSDAPAWSKETCSGELRGFTSDRRDALAADDFRDQQGFGRRIVASSSIEEFGAGDCRVWPACQRLHVVAEDVERQGCSGGYRMRALRIMVDAVESGAEDESGGGVFIECL